MDWQEATVVRITPAAEGIVSIVVTPSHWIPHAAGQHYELRMPGSESSRKYSVVSSPLRTGELEFGVKLYESGILSPKLWAAQPGDKIELRGPLGESFVWRPEMKGPVVLIGAGSGITPLLSIYEQYRAVYPQGKAVFVISAKTTKHIVHYAHLQTELVPRLTAIEGRIDYAYLATHVGPLAAERGALCYVCGSEDFIDTIVDDLLALGFPATGIRSEKFD